MPRPVHAAIKATGCGQGRKLAVEPLISGANLPRQASAAAGHLAPHRRRIWRPPRLQLPKDLRQIFINVLHPALRWPSGEAQRLTRAPTHESHEWQWPWLRRTTHLQPQLLCRQLAGLQTAGLQTAGLQTVHSAAPAAALPQRCPPADEVYGPSPLLSDDALVLRLDVHMHKAGAAPATGAPGAAA